VLLYLQHAFSSRLPRVQFPRRGGNVSATGPAEAKRSDCSPPEVQVNMEKQGFPEKNERLTRISVILDEKSGVLAL
jgi:hypothetical protein